MKCSFPPPNPSMPNSDNTNWLYTAKDLAQEVNVFLSCGHRKENGRYLLWWSLRHCFGLILAFSGAQLQRLGLPKRPSPPVCPAASLGFLWWWVSAVTTGARPSLSRAFWDSAVLAFHSQYHNGATDCVLAITMCVSGCVFVCLCVHVCICVCMCVF